MEQTELEKQIEERVAANQKKTYILFGQDISKIACFRNSWLYGISGGIASGIITFMFTSRVNLATHVMVGSTCAISLGYFCVCRYNYTKDELLSSQIRALINDTRGSTAQQREATISEVKKLLDIKD